PHTYADGPNNFTVTVTITDSVGASTSNTFTVTVTNVVPTITLTPVGAAVEGSPTTLTVSNYTDPGADTPTGVFVLWGDGVVTPLTPAQIVSLRGGSTVSLTHTYADGPGDYFVTSEVTDEDVTINVAGAATVSVANVAPTVTLSGAATSAE